MASRQRTLTTSKTDPGVSRRAFVHAGTATALTAASYRRVLGANDTVGVGFIGYGLIGKPHVRDFKQQPDVRILGLAEAHQGRLQQAAEHVGGGVKQYRDFRKLIDDKDIDAVVVSTPDHWHALMTMMACAAGKDVYVEKPLTKFVREGQWMLKVARQHQRVVQTGTQQRSGPHYEKARELIRKGSLGKIVSANVDFTRNLMPGLGNPPDQPAPRELDWDMFTGPAPLRPYNRNRGIYHFRWCWDYSGGQMTNWGAHTMDIVYWYLDQQGPRRVFSSGGRRYLQDNCETPDVQDTVFDFPDCSMSITIRDCSKGRNRDSLTFCGTNGSLEINRRGYTVTPDRKIHPNFVFPLGADNPVGGPPRGPMPTERVDRTTPVRDRSGSNRQMLNAHVRNFLDCVKSRQQPISELESGHRVTTALHLANISLRVNRPITWDAEAEEIVDDPEATRLLELPYRKPWDAELKALLG